MAMISITLTDDIDITPYNPTNPKYLGMTLYEKFYKDGNFVDLASTHLSFHGTRDQLAKFAQDLLEKVTLSKWVPETEPQSVNCYASSILDAPKASESQDTDSQIKVAYSQSGKPLAAY